MLDEDKTTDGLVSDDPIFEGACARLLCVSRRVGHIVNAAAASATVVVALV